MDFNFKTYGREFLQPKTLTGPKAILKIFILVNIYILVSIWTGFSLTTSHMTISTFYEYVLQYYNYDCGVPRPGEMDVVCLPLLHRIALKINS